MNLQRKEKHNKSEKKIIRRHQLKIEIKELKTKNPILYEQ